MTHTAERLPGEAVSARAASGESPSGEPAGADTPRIGVLALQGDVLEHMRMLRESGAAGVAVKRLDEVDGIEGLVIPGGESTTIGKLIEMYGLGESLRKRLADGMPAFGTCAGAILLGRATLLDDGRPSAQPLLGAIDIVTRRNAFGRQVASFEADLDVAAIAGGPLHAVFIRAPWIEEAGSGVEVLARVATASGDKVVVARQDSILVSAFHPELVGDGRLHRLFVDMVRARRARR